jgi:hypothetical protein
LCTASEPCCPSDVGKRMSRASMLVIVVVKLFIPGRYDSDA